MESLVARAKIAEQAERYSEMVRLIGQVFKQEPEITQEQRNLFSAGYKNLVASRRSSLRTINNLQRTEESSGNQRRLELLKAYRLKVEAEMNAICREVIDMIDYLVGNKPNSTENLVFFLKMKGDYFRYLSEFKSESTDQHQRAQSVAAQSALSAYQTAIDHAQSLPATDPTRLGLALNFSVLYYEVMDDLQSAINTSKTAIDQAISELDEVDEATYKDATTILQLLSDNRTLWISELQEKQAAV
jgi:14-3-3 protein epsilon